MSTNSRHTPNPGRGLAATLLLAGIAAVLTLVSAPHPSADAHALNPPRVPCHPGTQYISGGGWHPGYVFGARCEPIHAPNNPNAFKHRN